ncbi:hypothetical protein J4409_02225 [Candidatus Woesearchaeota archaeon]|nr:hypothetical protein [Candidatus Woesearchaeota archaeon]
MKEPKRKELFAKDKKFLEILSLAIENTGNNKIKMELGSIYQKYVNDLKGNGYDISRYTNDDNSVQKKQERIQECEKMTVLTEKQKATLDVICLGIDYAIKKADIFEEVRLESYYYRILSSDRTSRCNIDGYQDPYKRVEELRQKGIQNKHKI